MVLRFLKSVGFALKGIMWFIKNERNAPIHLLENIAVISLGIYTQLNLTEWGFVVIAIGVVFAAEIFNTAIEKTVDVIFKEQHEKAGLIKDLSAGGVFICSLLAVAIGLIVFAPKIMIHL